MTGAGDVAGWIRGKALLQRRVGAGTARRLAGAGDVPEAVRLLSTTPYGYAVTPGMDLAAAQRAVSATLLWHLRILAGWQTPLRSSPIRSLAAGFEVANTVDLLLSLEGADRPAPFELGSLSTAWRALRPARSPDQVRAVLGHSRWGDPGSADPAAVRLAMTVEWAYRVWDEVPAAGSWAREAAKLLAAHLEASGVQAGVSPATRHRLQQLIGREPDTLGVDRLEEAWLRWWHQVAERARAMTAGGRPGPEATAGVVGLLAVDAWRVRAALALSAAPEGRDGWEDLLGAVA